MTLSNQLKIPTFYAGKLDESEQFFTDIIASIVAVFFGVIHCIAWSLEHPSQTEQLLWRISSVAVASIPGIWGLFFLVGILVAKDKIDTDGWIWKLFGIPIAVLGAIAVPVYIAARVILLTLAFTSLRSLPQAAYQTVSWTTFIPHI